MEGKLNLTQPLDGTFGEVSVRLVKVGARDAQIVHEEDLDPGTRAPLRFVWRTVDIEVPAEVVRTAGSRSALALEEHATLQRLVDESAEELRRAQEANAMGDREGNVIGDGTLTAASHGARLGRKFLIYELRDGQWRCHTAQVPKHPDNGFAVFADESEEQIEMLCHAFESGDEEARRTTKILAQISLQSRQ